MQESARGDQKIDARHVPEVPSRISEDQPGLTDPKKKKIYEYFNRHRRRFDNSSQKRAIKFTNGRMIDVEPQQKVKAHMSLYKGAREQEDLVHDPNQETQSTTEEGGQQNLHSAKVQSTKFTQSKSAK